MINVCLGYICGDEWPLLEMSLKTMLSYDWVKEVLILDTVNDRPCTRMHLDRRVRVLGRDCGQGDTFDEVYARNLLLAEMEVSNQEWLLLCDPDEFYLPSLGNLIVPPEKNSALLECWHACDLHHHIPQTVQVIQGVPLLDPHPRLLRNRCGYRFVRNLAWKGANRTTHCFVPVDLSSALICQKPYHIHVRHMFKESPKPEQNVELLPWTIVPHWPEHYQQAWRDGWAAVQGVNKAYPVSPIILFPRS